MIGAADVPVELVRRIRRDLPFRAALTGYGLTEAGGVRGHRGPDRRPTARSWSAAAAGFPLSHPSVSQVAGPDERLGSVAKAFVVRAAGSALTPAELITWSRSRMAGHKARLLAP